ncbi:helix-turn-helix domain-containing protein [Rhodococcoides fascians]|uniref:helix-turn-helix domain-containing protein n=1 Tax=Rhodococcoides fascians TaxID=1828 RepID=UPI0018AFFAA7|nr:helix-turn-helix transcriptional regulator [Rhodococcus fascians]
MSTQTDGATGLPSSAATAQRLRQYMGDKKISRAKLALAAGIGRTPLGKKLDGEVGFGFDEISAVCQALGLQWAWVTTGEGDAESPRPDGDPNGGLSVRHQGFEPRTR